MDLMGFDSGAMENGHPLLSIITPVYNVERYLEKCVSSIIAQSFVDWELILVDDGSSDASGRLCDDYAAQDARIQVVHQANAGASAARNAGLSLSRGEYVTFVDADDYIVPDTYEKNIEYLESDISLDLVLFPIVRDEFVHQVDITSGRDKNELKSIFDVWYQHYPMQNSFCNKIVKRKLIGDSRFPVGKITGEDLAFASQLWDNIHHIYVSSEGAYYYNTENANSVTRRFDKQRMKEKLDEMGIFSRYILGHKELREYAIPFFVGRLIELFKVFSCHDYHMDADDVCVIKTNRPSLNYFFSTDLSLSDRLYYIQSLLLGIRPSYWIYIKRHKISQ